MRKKLLKILNASCKEVPSLTEGAEIKDLAAEPQKIASNLWAAHKMPDTQRLKDLLAKDHQELIEVRLMADESRPKGTMGAEYDSLIGTYHFYKKKTAEDKEGYLLKGYSLIVAFYQKKPKASD